MQLTSTIQFRPITLQLLCPWMIGTQRSRRRPEPPVERRQCLGVHAQSAIGQTERTILGETLTETGRVLFGNIYLDRVENPDRVAIGRR